MIRLLIFILVIPLNVDACSCGNLWGPVTIKDYNSSEFIISVKAIKVTIDEKEVYDKQRKIDFQIDEIYKGKIEGKSVTIYTALSDASCGLYVKENEEWIIWAYIHNNVISTSLCTRSKLKQYIKENDFKSLQYFKSNPPSTEWKNDKGVLIAEGKLKNNLPVGLWKYFYNNGYIESEGVYKNGKEDGKWISYLDPEGIVRRLRYDKAIPEDSIPDLDLLKNRFSQIQNYKEGIREGEFVYFAYYSIDKPFRITNYKNGLIDGKSIMYYDNGMIYYEQNYSGDKLEGYERFYFPNGQIKQEGKFVNGRATGEFKLYNETGLLMKTSIDKRPED